MKEGIRRIAIAGFLWTFFQKIGGQVVSFVVFVVLARLLSPEDFGLVAIANVLIAFLTLFTGAALTAALVQRPDIEALHLDTMFWTVTGLSVGLGVGTWIFADEMSVFFNESSLEPILRWLVVCLPLSAIQQVQISLLRRELNFKSLSLRLLVSQPIAGVVGISFAVLGFGVWSLVARTISSLAIQALVMWFTVAWRPRFYFSVLHFREMFGFGIHVAGANFVTFLSGRLDVFLIGYMLGAAPLGIYTVAKRLIQLLVELIGGTIEHVAWPIFSRIQSDREKVVAVFHKATKYVSLLAFPVFAGIAILAEVIIPVVFGEKWQLSAQLMRVLACVGLAQAVLYFHETLMVGMGRPQYKLTLRAISALANLAAFFLAIKYGLVAVTVGYAIVAVAMAPLWVVYVRKIVALDVLQYFRDYRSALVGTVIMAAFLVAANNVLGLNQLTVSVLMIQISLGVFAYAAVIVVLEKQLVWDFARALTKHSNSSS